MLNSITINSSKYNLKPTINMYFNQLEKAIIPISKELITTEQWVRRYIGSFGLEGWVNVSGEAFLSPGEIVTLKKQTYLASKKRPRSIPLLKNTKTNPFFQKVPCIIRFYNSKGIEIGRIPQEPAVYMSSLLDLDTCSFTASCIYAPNKMRIGGDKVLLQITCFIHRHAFSILKQPSFSHKNNTHQTPPVEEMLELHRIAILWLLTEIGLKPNDSETLDCKTVFKEMITTTTTKKLCKSTPLPKTNTIDSFDEDNFILEEQGKELEKDQLDFLYKSTESYNPNIKEMEPSSSFNLTLKPYQKQALYWMINKERENDSLEGNNMIHPLWQAFRWPSSDENGEKIDFGGTDDQFYLNPYSGKLSLEFPKADNAYCGGILADEMGLGKTIEVLSLIHSNKLEIPSNTKPHIMDSNTPILSCRTTLVVAPISLLEQWRSEAEIASKPNSLKTQIYYGIDKSIDILTQCQTSNQPDLLITSYGIVLSEWSQMIANNESTFNLFKIDFYRVVLDEAHYIKNRLSKTAKACFALNARKRWVLTGTPIINKLEDLFSLIHFLKVEPWGNFMFWKTFITIPFESREIVHTLNTVCMIFENLILRRTKTTKDIHGNLIITLPPKEIITEEIILSPKEREIYNYIYMKAKQTFIENSAAGTVFKNYITILTMLLRLRQSCCHPSLLKHKTKNDLFNLLLDGKDFNHSIDINDDIKLKDLIESFGNQITEEKNINTYNIHAIKNILEKTENECPICSADPMIEKTVTHCWHMACKLCLQQHIEFQKAEGRRPLCHICRSPIDEQKNCSSEDSDFQVVLRKSSSISSSKLDALIKHLSKLKMSNPHAKSVVFSQFTSFLDLVEIYMKRDDFEFLRLDGGMTMKDRLIVLEKFRLEKKGLVLLISQRSGNVGLNLTVASHVFILDPWWNFSMENQAIDRVHRIGQTLPVKVIHSVEEKMVQICKRKLILANISIMGYQSREEITKQRLEELQTLFE
ncbi:hypothetical protein PCK1_000518 [Pneumocystis canis]|nr:hypothetical protein PCK1_000518 [Pneumocystis canis]